MCERERTITPVGAERVGRGTGKSPPNQSGLKVRDCCYLGKGKVTKTKISAQKNNKLLQSVKYFL